MSLSVRLKTRNITWLSGYCTFRSRPCLDSRFRPIFRNSPVSEMPAVQVSRPNCENLLVSFELKDNCQMNGETCALIYAFYIVKVASSFFFWVRMELIVCIFKLLNSIRFFSDLQQFASHRFGESFCYNNLIRCKSGKCLDILQSQ